MERRPTIKRITVPNLFAPGEGRRIDRLSWRPDLTLADLVPEGWRRDRTWALHHGKRVNPRAWPEREVGPGDEVLFVADPRGVEAALIGIGVSAWLAATVAFVVNLGLSVGLSLLAQKLLATDDPGEEASPTYSFGNLTMTTRSGQTIPVVYGEHRVAGQVLQAVPTKDEGGNDVLQLLVGLCEGPIQSIGGLTSDQNALTGSSIPDGIRVNGNAASDLEGVKVWTRLGTKDQEPIPGFEALSSVVPIDVTLEKDVAVENTTETAVTAFTVVLLHPDGLYRQTSKGKIRSESVWYQVRWRKNGEAAWYGSETVEYRDTKTAPFTSHYRNDEPGQVYGEAVTIDVEVTRLSDDSDYRHHRSLNWNATIERQGDLDLSYTHIALVGISIPAQAQANSDTPTVTSNLEGKKVWQWDPTDLEPTTTTWSFAYSANPAHCLADLALNERYGAGNIFTACDLDLDALDAWRQYCDELVDDLSGTSTMAKRWELALVLDSPMSFWSAAGLISAAGRAQLLLAGQKLRVKIERAVDPVQLFTVGNIERDSLRIQYTSVEDRPNLVEVQILNAATNYEHDYASLQDEERLAATGAEVRKEEVTLYGVTAKWRALRQAQYLLNVAKLMLTGIEFRAGVDAVALEPGDVFAFQHDVPDWDSSFGGRCYAAAGNATVTLDRELTVTSTDEEWRVWARTSGTGADVLQDRRIVADVGTYAAGTELTLTSDWDPGDRPAQGDVYAVLNAAGSSTIRYYRAVEVELAESLTRRISGLEYTADLYDDTPDLVVDDEADDPINRGAIPPNPSSLTLTEGGDSTGSTLTVAVVPAEWPWRYPLRVYMRDATEGETELGLEAEITSRKPHVTLDTVENGHTYVVAVAPGAADGSVFRAPDRGITGSITLEGPVNFPDDVTGVAVTQNETFVEVTWTGIDADVNDFREYVVWRGQSWALRRELARIADPYTTRLQTTDWAVGDDFFGVRVLSNTSLYSEAPGLTTATLAVPSGESTDTSRDEVSLGWTGTKTNVTVNGNGELELSASQTSGTYVSGTVDEGSSAARRVGLNAQAWQDDATAWDDLTSTWSELTTTWDAETGTWASYDSIWDSRAAKLRSWEGSIPSQLCTLDLAISLDGGDYQAYVPGVYTYQTVAFRLTLARDDATNRQVRVDACLLTTSS